jgi:DNA-binding Xre family transcriptional regulator
MDVIRIRLPELLNKEIPTAYAIAKASRDRISQSAAHRLVAKRGAVQRYDADLLEALCEMFKIGPGELLELDVDRKRRARTK